MSRTLVRGLLFGGAIWAAGLAPADTAFNYVAGTDGFVAYASASAGTDTISETLFTPPPPSVFGQAYASCEGGGSYNYGSAWSQFNLSSTRMDHHLGTDHCDRSYGEITAYFDVATPTEFDGYYTLMSTGTLGIWSRDGAKPLVWGPGDGATGTASASFVLGPGRYTFRFRHVTMPPTEDAQMWLNVVGDACVCDLDANGTLNFDDIDAFVAAFLAGDLAADLDFSGALNLDDLDAFVACFLGGCG